MTDFLLTWKETGWPYENILRMVKEVDATGHAEEPWRIKAHKLAKTGDRVWLLKQGRGLKGIFGVGEITGPPALGDTGDHKLQWMAPVRFTSLVDPKQKLLIDEKALGSVLKPGQFKVPASGYPLDETQSSALESILISTPITVLGGSGDWTPAEINAIVADYFSMLRDELAGLPYSKTEHREALLNTVQRSPGSIERKHQNISAVLNELNLPWINGYKPYGNYQDALVEAVVQQLPGQIEEIDKDPVTPPPSLPASEVFVAPPVPKPGSRKKDETPSAVARIARKFDPALRDEANRKLGLAGEEFVVGVERDRLTAAARPDLSQKVTWVSNEQGDGLGYDISSFAEDGTEIFIEVKTTKGPIRTPFILSKTELAVAAEKGDVFRLYRVFDYAKKPKIYALAGPLEKKLSLDPLNYRARIAPGT